jgi:hypothetical protein
MSKRVNPRTNRRLSKYQKKWADRAKAQAAENISSVSGGFEPTKKVWKHKLLVKKTGHDYSTDPFAPTQPYISQEEIHVGKLDVSKEESSVEIDFGNVADDEKSSIEIEITNIPKILKPGKQDEMEDIFQEVCNIVHFLKY